MESRELTLREISGGGTYGLGASASTDEIGPKFLRTTDIVTGKIDWDKVPYCKADSATLKKYRLYPNDIVISRTGANAGLNCLVIDPPKDAIFAGYLVRFQVNDSIADPKFVSYVLRSNYWHEYVENTRTGSAQPQFNAVLMGNFSLKLPELKVQKRISNLLGMLDEKIAVNTSISKTLENIAQTKFNSWFLNFASDLSLVPSKKHVISDALEEDIPSLTLETNQALFPEGWTAGVLGDYLEPLRGKTITKAQAKAGTIPVVGGGLGPAYFHNEPNVSPPVVTISASGANAGFVRLYSEPIWASDCSFINSTNCSHTYFWYLFLKSSQTRIFNMQQGAAQPHIYPSDLKRLPIVFPPIEVLDAFEEIMTPIFHSLGIYQSQTKTLESIRDALLPRLLSGEVEIPTEGGSS